MAVEALRHLIDSTQGGRLAVAAAIHANEQTLYQIVAGVPLKSGRARTVGRDLRERLDRAFPGWLDARHPPSVGQAPTATPPERVVAHGLILDEFTVPPLSTWEELMQSKELPALFRVAVPDDALAPKIPRGAELIMAAGGTPRPSQVILVREVASGQLHLRRYAQGTGGNWQARAPNVDYPTFDSRHDQLELLARLKGVWSEDA